MRRRTQKCTLLGSICLLLSPSTTLGALQADTVNTPAILDDLGRMGVVGQYEGISQYTYSGQQNSISDPYYDSIIAQVSDTTFLNQGTSNGLVTSFCQIDNMIYMSGNFTTIGSIDTPGGLARLNASSGDIESLENSLNGTVYTLYCDSANNTVYAGGNFTYRNQTGTAIYNPDDSSWSVPSFGGFPSGSEIKSILPFNDNIIFAGSFNGLANDSYVGTSTGDNSTLLNSQRISFNLSTIFADGTADGNDPRSIVCPSDNSDWVMEDNRVGSWNALWPFYFNPTLLRLSNLKESGNGVSIFRIRSFPSNGIMNLTYINSTTNEQQYCDAWCTLPLSSEESSVDFDFVNVIGMNGLQIEILDTYGSHGGLDGIEIFQNDAFTFANQSFNLQDSCGQTTYTALSTLSGNFVQPDVSGATYVTTNISETSQISSVSVVYEPNITISGNYSIMLFTPGCLQDGTCSSRAGVNVTIEATSNEDPVVLTLYETNSYDKYDYIYTGDVEKISNEFRPRVTLTPLRNQAVPFVFVADRIQVVLNSIAETISINSIFEFDASNFTNVASNPATLPVGNTTINAVGPLLGRSADIRTLYSANDSLYVGGNFSSSRIGRNFIKIDSNSVESVNGRGLDGPVNNIQAYSSDELLVIGRFNGPVNSSVDGTSNIALYNTNGDSWSSVGHGTNGEVLRALTFDVNGTTTIGFSGNFTETFTNDSTAIPVSNGFGIWVQDENSWFSDSSLSGLFLQARLSDSASFNNTMFYAGYIRLFESASSGASFLNSDFSLSSAPFTFVSDSNSTNSTSLRKRNTILNGGDNTINAGVFANSSFSILGGHFTAEANDSVYSNLIMIDEEIVTGLPDGAIDETSIFYDLHIADNILYAGGAITGNVSTNSISGIVFYDLGANSFSSNQPPGISGGQEVVTSIQVRPNTNQLIVAGSFEQAGSLTCNSFCIYDLTGFRWYSPSPGMSGLVSSMEFIGSDLLVFAGDLTLNNTQVYLAQYDFVDSSFTTFGEQSTDLPGPINSFVLNGDVLDSVFASGLDSSSGDAYISHWNGSNWNRIDSLLQSGSVVTDLSVLKLQNQHTANDVLPRDQVLLVSGNIVLQDFGNASSVFFDGSSWQPAFITTTSNGESGSVNSFFSQSSTSFTPVTGERGMKRGFVVLIALAIAVGLTFLLVALGLLVAYIRRKRQGYTAAPYRVSEAEMAETIPPATLFEEMSHANVPPRTRASGNI